MSNSQRIVEGMLSASKGKPGRKAKDPIESLRKQVIETQARVILAKAPNYASIFSQVVYLVQSRNTLADRIARTETKLAKLRALYDFHALPDTEKTLEKVLAATRETSNYVERKLQACATAAEVLSVNIETLASEADALFLRQGAPALPDVSAKQEDESEES